MTPVEFRNWRERMNLDRNQVAKLLGVARRTITYYEAGVRETGRPYPIPKTTELACAALTLGITHFTGVADQTDSPDEQASAAAYS